MGYYSQVAIGLRNANADAMMGEFIQKFPDSGLFDKCRSGCICHKGKEHTVFYWDSIKWYRGNSMYKDVQWVMDYLYNTLDRDTEPFYFVRIGENMGDVEDDCNPAEAEENEIHGACFEPITNIGFYGEFRALVEDAEEAFEPLKKWGQEEILTARKKAAFLVKYWENRGDEWKLGYYSGILHALNWILNPVSQLFNKEEEKEATSVEVWQIAADMMKNQ